MKYTIRQFVDNEDRLILPAIQREYVWTEEQICRLFDSILRRYPIGNLLLWNLDGSKIKEKGIDFYKLLDNYSEMNPEYNQVLDNPSPDKSFYAILDGQQRTQSLVIGLRGYLKLKVYRARKNNEDSYKNKYLYINLLGERNEEDDFEYELKFLANEELTSKEQAEKLWFKVGQILTYKELPDVSDIFLNITLDQEQIKKANKIIRNLFYQINENEEIIHWDEIPSDMSLDEVLNIFVRTNSGGTVLSKTDLLFSTLVSNWSDARENIEELMDTINNKGGQGARFKFTKDFIMRSLLYMLDESTTLHLKDVKKNIDSMKDNWEDLSNAIKKAPKLLRYLGYSHDNLTSYNAVMPIIYYIYKGGILEEKEKNEFRKYLVIAQMKKLYGVASSSTLTSIRNVLIDENGKLKNKHFKLSDLKDTKIVGNRNFEVDDEVLDSWLEEEKGDYTFMILTLLYPCNKIETTSYHQDHMHPESKLKNTKFKDKRNILANLQLLEAKENESKNDEELEEWLKNDPERKKNTKYLPECSYKLENYEEFIELRKSLMKKELKKILEMEEIL